jgi:hypothetical protein
MKEKSGKFGALLKKSNKTKKKKTAIRQQNLNGDLYYNS